jgi:hypothetical protein
MSPSCARCSVVSFPISPTFLCAAFWEDLEDARNGALNA